MKELTEVDALPTLPEVVTRVMQALDADDVDVETVANLIAQDPALTGQILRMANSVMFNACGLSTTSIHEAIGRIGLRSVRNIVVSIGVVRTFDGLEGLDFGEFWRHSFSSAVAAGAVAQCVPGIQAPRNPRDNPYFLAGLLHDVGSLLFLQHLGDEFTELVSEARAKGQVLHEVELERLGADHQQAGAALIRRWGLPLEVAAAAEHHHRASGAPEDGRDFVLVVAAADFVLGQNGRCSPAEPEPRDAAALEALGVEEGKVSELTVEVVAAAESSDTLLSAALSG